MQGKSYLVNCRLAVQRLGVAQVRPPEHRSAECPLPCYSQIAEAAFSNKGVAVSPCEVCGQAASADMAQILSISLGQTQENADMRIGHAAVALLNARQQLPGGVGSSPTVGGGAVDGVLPYTRPGGLPSLAIPDCSWKNSIPPEGTSPASTLIYPPTPLSSRHAAQHPSFLPPPAPKFSANANFASLLPPLPSFNSPTLATPPYQAAAGGSPGPLPAPLWQDDYRNVVEGVFAADGSPYNLPPPQPDLLDVVEGTISWPPKSAGMTSSPALRPCEKPRASMVNEVDLTAHPIPNWGQMSVLLGSKARAREVSPGGGLLESALQKGVPATEADAPPLKRSHGSLDNLFAADGPAAERQLSADELTIKGYLEEDNDRELCATNAGGVTDLLVC
jgi:hypothetical protein